MLIYYISATIILFAIGCGKAFNKAKNEPDQFEGNVWLIAGFIKLAIAIWGLYVLVGLK